MPTNVVVTFNLKNAKNEEYDSMYAVLKSMGIDRKLGDMNTAIGSINRALTADQLFNAIVGACTQKKIPLSALYVGFVSDQAFSS